MTELKPTEGLDLEQEGTGPAAGAAGLLNDDSASHAAGAAIEDAEAVDFDDDEIYRRPGELAVCSEKTPGIRHRFTVMPDPVNPGKAFLRRVFTHYVMNKGHAQCLSKHNAKGEIVGEPAFCCKGPEGPSKPRLGAVVVEYTCTDPKTGKFKAGVGGPGVPFEYEIKALLLTQFGASALRKKAGELENPDGGVEGIPLKVFEVDYFYEAAEGKKGLGFERIAPKASYVKVPELLAGVLAAFEPFKDGKGLAARMSRKMTANQLREHLSIGGGSTAAGGQLDGFQDL